jgi:hypothetical protein
MAIAVRAVSSAYVNNNSTVTVALPAGTAAGDTLVVLAGHAYQVNTPTPATFEQSQWTNIGNYNGAAYVKLPVQASDVTAGSVTVTFTGAYYGHVVLIAFTGAIIGISAKQIGSSSGGAASRTLTTPATAKAGDYCLFFAAGRVNGAISSTSGAALASDAQANSSMVLTGALQAADGSATSTFSYTVVPTGEFQSILVVSELVGPSAQEYNIAAETLKGAQSDAQTYDISAEALRGATASAQVFDVAVEVLRAVTIVLRRRPVILNMEVIADAGINYLANTLFVDGSPVLIDGSSVEF